MVVCPYPCHLPPSGKGNIAVMVLVVMMKDARREGDAP